MYVLEITIVLSSLVLIWNLVFLLQKTMKRCPRILRWILSTALVLPGIFIRSYYTLFLLHLSLFLLIFRLLFHDKKIRKRLILIPFLCAILLIAYGMWNIHNIQHTEYQLETDKEIEPTTVVALADLHYPTGMEEEDVQNLVQRLKAEDPDFYVLAGDIVDEFTTQEEMISLFAQLGSLADTAPVYMIFGNHDDQHYAENKEFDLTVLEQTAQANNITVLKDETITINDITLIGRKDEEDESRKSLQELLQGIDDSKYLIVLDHQPVDLEQGQALHVDLQISGHTHNGQIFPLGYFMTGYYENVYGLYQNQGYSQITTSGCNGWGYALRTMGKSEYVVIKID